MWHRFIYSEPLPLCQNNCCCHCMPARLGACRFWQGADTVGLYFWIICNAVQFRVFNKVELSSCNWLFHWHTLPLMLLAALELVAMVSLVKHGKTWSNVVNHGQPCPMCSHKHWSTFSAALDMPISFPSIVKLTNETILNPCIPATTTNCLVYAGTRAAVVPAPSPKRDDSPAAVPHSLAAPGVLDPATQ